MPYTHQYILKKHLLKLTDLDKGWNDGLDGPHNDLEAVTIVLVQHVGAHEGEDGHDVMQYMFLKLNQIKDVINQIIQIISQPSIDTCDFFSPKLGILSSTQCLHTSI